MKQIVFLILFVLLTAPVFAQSTNENFPTPILENQISGKIAARDVGDARLTRYFYVFLADNGDVDLNIETANFDGDVDLFESETLQPLAKITIAAGTGSNQTTRQVYFRKRGQVVLRIEGRSLTDDAATYRIAFSGSFLAATDLQQPADTEPKVIAKSSSEAINKVNSAGAIIEVFPLKKPEARQPEEPTTVSRTPRKTVVKPQPTLSKTESAENIDRPANETNKAENLGGKPPRKPSTPKSKTPVKTSKPARISTTKKTTADASKTRETIPLPDPLSDIQLVILLKNGDRVARSMSEVFNVSVDKGLITVITKAGKITRYNLLNVQKMTIE